MDVQHLDLKIPLEHPEHPDLGIFIPVFHRWVREQLGDGLLIDVADYRHVFGGPGVVLVGHDGNYGLDMTGNRPGLRYIRKTPVPGGLQAALDQALGALERAQTLLESDAAFGGTLRFDARVLELRINDRLLAPNHPDTLTALQPELIRAFEHRVGADRGVRIDFTAQPRDTFGVTVQSSASLFGMPKAA